MLHRKYLEKIQKSNELNELWDITREITREYYPDSDLMPIVGGGCIERAKLMLVFINPTYRNSSTDQNWDGFRAPFIGTRHVWRVFGQAGLISNEILHEINERNIWDVPFAQSVYEELRQRGIYMTNIVKWAGENADLPDQEKVSRYKPVLMREIELVQPDFIVTMGGLPYKEITGNQIILRDHYEKVMKDEYEPESLKLNETTTKVFPSYFPVGRGNPKRAVEILRKLSDL